MNKVDRIGKTDRTARLLKVEHLLYQNPKGLMIEEIARLCGVSKRTTYRDLKALESELSVPIWEEGVSAASPRVIFFPLSILPCLKR